MAIDDAIAIWKAGVAAVDPRQLVVDAIANLRPELYSEIVGAPAIHVVGAGKAGAAMALGIEAALANCLSKVGGIVNVPDGMHAPCQNIVLHAARPRECNFPTEMGVIGAKAAMTRLQTAGPEDAAICLLSGGGSALWPLPVDGVSLDDKLKVTRLLHGCGATIQELNCVRKHLSKIKGGGLAEAFCGRWLLSLIISDVIRDPLDVIASGPTVADPTTFADALRILKSHAIEENTPASVLNHFRSGADGHVPETPKQVRLGALNSIIGSNEIAQHASVSEARNRGYQIEASDYLRDKDYDIHGEARQAANWLAKLIPEHISEPTAILFGGETTVTLGPNSGKGGRNQEFVLAMLCELGEAGMKGVTILCAGTDGEDGPTDAAGAIGTEETLKRAKALNLDPRDYLDRHDSYHFFEATGGLFKTGLTGTNVMDLGVILLK